MGEMEPCVLVVGALDCGFLSICDFPEVSVQPSVDMQLVRVIQLGILGIIRKPKSFRICLLLFFHPQNYFEK
jgi:hypothetical protein